MRRLLLAIKPNFSLRSKEIPRGSGRDLQIDLARASRTCHTSGDSLSTDATPQQIPPRAVFVRTCDTLWGISWLARQPPPLEFFFQIKRGVLDMSCNLLED